MALIDCAWMVPGTFMGLYFNYIDNHRNKPGACKP